MTNKHHAQHLVAADAALEILHKMTDTELIQALDELTDAARDPSEEPEFAETLKKMHYGAVVVNELGDILPYTMESTIEQCHEKAVQFWGEATWDTLQKLGAYVAPCTITLR